MRNVCYSVQLGFPTTYLHRHRIVYDEQTAELKKPLGEIKRPVVGWWPHAVADCSRYRANCALNSHNSDLRRLVSLGVTYNVGDQVHRVVLEDPPEIEPGLVVQIDREWPASEVNRERS